MHYIIVLASFLAYGFIIKDFQCAWSEPSVQLFADVKTMCMLAMQLIAD